MKKETIIESVVKASVETEWQEYKERILSGSKEDIFKNAYRIMVTETFYDLFTYGEYDWISGKSLIKIHDKAAGHILASLVDEYFDSEWCDIANDQDIKDLVNNYAKDE